MWPTGRIPPPLHPWAGNPTGLLTPCPVPPARPPSPCPEPILHQPRSAGAGVALCHLCPAAAGRVDQTALAMMQGCQLAFIGLLPQALPTINPFSKPVCFTLSYYPMSPSGICSILALHFNSLPACLATYYLISFEANSPCNWEASFSITSNTLPNLSFWC